MSDTIAIAGITLREIQLPLREPFRISSGMVTTRRIILLELTDRDGVAAWSECVAGERPNYSPETIDTAWLAIVRHDALIVKAVTLEAGQARYLATYEANDIGESQNSEFDASDAVAAARFAVDGGAFAGFEHPVTSAAALVEGSRFALATWIV